MYSHSVQCSLQKQAISS